MGAGMAANVVKAGYDVGVLNRSHCKAGWLVERGAHEVTSVDADSPQKPPTQPG
jgi:3-hydroxyisobutyrate dehydrogenase-like beta-hydroxyacid dehydrogenase